MAAIRVASVWGPVGFDRLRISDADDVFLAWMAFVPYGSLHWPNGHQGHAIQIILGCPLSHLAACWGRGAYEQGPLVTVPDIATVSGCKTLVYHSGEDGRMVACGVHHLPVVGEATTHEFRTAMSEDITQPKQWIGFMSRFFQKHNSLPLESIRLRQFQVSLHLFGGLKECASEVARITLCYELFCRCTAARELHGSKRIFDIRQAAGAQPNATAEELCCPEVWPNTLRALHPRLAFANVAGFTGIYFTDAQMRQLSSKVRIIHSSMLDEHVQVCCRNPRYIYIILPGALNTPIDPRLCEDGVQVTFTAHLGFGGTGHRADRPDGSLGFSDHADVGTLHMLCQHHEALLRCGAFFLQLIIDAGKHVRVRPPAAHFLPTDGKIQGIIATRIRKLLRWASVKYPNLPLVVVAESAGTHMARSVLRAFAEVNWTFRRVVLSGFCFPPQFMRELMLLGDHRFALVVHGQDRICPMQHDHHFGWEFLRERGMVVQFMDIPCWQLNRQAYGGSIHSLLSPYLHNGNTRLWFQGSQDMAPTGFNLELRPFGLLFNAVQLFAAFVLRSVIQTFNEAQAQIRDRRKRRITPFRNRLEGAIIDVQELLRKQPHCLHPYANAGAGPMPMLQLFAMLNRHMGNFWDFELLKVIGQSQALVLLWILLRFGFQDIFTQADIFDVLGN